MADILPREIRKKFQRELMEQVEWINKRDPWKKSDKMQGAKYAYMMCWKRLQQIGYQKTF